MLSHHSVNGVLQTRQGVVRRLSPQAVATLELTLRLTRALGLPTNRALELAQQSIEARNVDNRLPLADAVALVIDVDLLMADVARRLADAVEMAPSPRRGRPPR